jgi:hypothetical protein
VADITEKKNSQQLIPTMFPSMAEMLELVREQCECHHTQKRLVTPFVFYRLSVV